MFRAERWPEGTLGCVRDSASNSKLSMVLQKYKKLIKICGGLLLGGRSAQAGSAPKRSGRGRETFFFNIFGWK